MFIVRNAYFMLFLHSLWDKISQCFGRLWEGIWAALSWYGPSPEGPKPNFQRASWHGEDTCLARRIPPNPDPSNSSGALESCPRHCPGHETVFYTLPPPGRQVRGGAWRARTQGISPAGALGSRVDLSGGALRGALPGRFGGGLTAGAGQAHVKRNVQARYSR
jgi:hypothetical protein